MEKCPFDKQDISQLKSQVVERLSKGVELKRELEHRIDVTTDHPYLQLLVNASPDPEVSLGGVPVVPGAGLPRLVALYPMKKVCTHSPVARTFFWCTNTASTLRTYLSVLHTCTAQGSRVSAVRMPLSLCHLAFSLLMFHPSLLLLFLDGHFETTPDLDDLTD